MILVEVFVPMLNRGFDFQLDEKGLVEDITEEIAETVCQSQQCILKGKYEDLILCKAGVGGRRCAHRGPPDPAVKGWTHKPKPVIHPTKHAVCQL